MPPDANVVTDLMKQNLLGVFSERNAEKRRTMIAMIWEKDGVFVDPDGRWAGPAAINDAADQLQRRFPDFTFTVLKDGDAYNGVGRLPWGFGPPDDPQKIIGIDVCIASDGRRIVSLCTFVDAVKG
jgi:hypothetical protein